MEFELKGNLQLTGKIDKTAIAPLIEEANKTVLVKGAGSGKGSKVQSFDLTGNELHLKMKSDRYVRAHDGLLRLRKFLAEKLGKAHHIGVRKLSIPEYKITFAVDSTPIPKLSIPLATDVSVRGNKCTLTLKDIGEEFLQKNYIDRMINLIKEKTAKDYGGKAEHWELLWSSKKRKMAWDKDPTTEMEKKGWLKRTKSRGQWIYGPQITRIFRTMQQIVQKELLEKLKFDEIIVPKMVTWDVWAKSGHAKSLYPEMYYVSTPLKRDPALYEDIADHFKVTGEVPAEKLKAKISAPIGGVTYAQCPPFWPFLEGKTLADESLPVKVYDASGTSMRYESGGAHGIERVEEFHRIEVIWLGTLKHVHETRDQLVECYKHIFNDILELEWRMAWVTPWFLAQTGETEADDKKHVVGTIDFEAYLPYRGTRKDAEWLEFQNCSNNGTKYPDAFNVKCQSNEQVYSGCTGIGLERWVASFTAQHGIDPANWPEGFKKYLKKMPKEIKCL